jgi:hypothetical protein
VLTIAKLKRWSINYYIDTAQTAETASRDRARAGGGLGEYYAEHETRTPTWLLAGDIHTAARLIGLTDTQRTGGDADGELVVRWLDYAITPNGAHGRAFGSSHQPPGQRARTTNVCPPRQWPWSQDAHPTCAWHNRAGASPTTPQRLPRYR